MPAKILWDGREVVINSPAELDMAFDIVTHGGARGLGLADYGITPGARADFVTFRAQHVAEAVVAVPKSRSLYKAGRLIAQDGKLI